MISSESGDEVARSIGVAFKDLVLGLFLLGGGLYAAYRINFVERPSFLMSTGSLDYATVPTVAALGIAFLAAIYTVGTFLRLVALGGFTPSRWRRFGIVPSRAAFRRMGTVVLLVGYVFAMGPLPYWLATAIFLAGMFALFGQTSPLRIAIVAIVGSAGLTALFVHILRLPL